MILSMDIRLDIFKQEHVFQTFQWISDDKLRQEFLMCAKAPIWQNHLDYFDRVFADKAQYFYAIMADNQHVGNCGIKNIRLKQEGELWIYVADSSVRGKGVATRAVDILLCEGFGKLELDLIFLHVDDGNNIAKRLYSNFGFKEAPMSLEETDLWGRRQERIIRMELRRK
jgi:RimJ/RimL family protein N-acetyltransferase